MSLESVGLSKVTSLLAYSPYSCFSSALKSELYNCSGSTAWYFAPMYMADRLLLMVQANSPRPYTCTADRLLLTVRANTPRPRTSPCSHSRFSSACSVDILQLCAPNTAVRESQKKLFLSYSFLRNMKSGSAARNWRTGSRLERQLPEAPNPNPFPQVSSYGLSKKIILSMNGTRLRVIILSQIRLQFRTRLQFETQTRRRKRMAPEKTL